MEYLDFVSSKKHLSIDAGIAPIYMHDSAFDYQKYVAEHAIKKGRCAVFLDTGLGKTIIQLIVAQNYIRHSNKPVLIITPLAVAFQFLTEAEKFGIDDISYSRDGSYKTKIVVCNYERLDKFNASDFDCVLLDESSILKNFDGAIKAQVTSFLKQVKYRYLFTATPSPNDFVELGTSSEALGYMGHMDMLGRFFANNENNIRPQEIGNRWYLKPHAEGDFFSWVSSWAISMRKPSDLGFSDENYTLPELIVNKTVVTNNNNWCLDGQFKMFGHVAKTMSEVRQEQRMTIHERCIKAASLVDEYKISFAWCNFNDEGELLEDLIPNSINVEGSSSLDEKEEAIRWFIGEKCICNSEFFGLNWQKTKDDLCRGIVNMQKIEELNISHVKLREIGENLNVATVMKIRSIWQIITQKIKINSNCVTTESTKKTQEEESVINLMQNIERLKKNTLATQQVQNQDLRDFLNNMALIKKFITQNSKSKIINVLYAKLPQTMTEKDLDFILTIVMKQEYSEVFSAHAVTSDSDTSETAKLLLSKQSCICGHLSGIRRIISKPKIMGFGLNFQHCNHTVYFPTFSYEQYYQAIRRFWRFGQKRPVTVDLVLSDGQQRVVDALDAKRLKAEALFQKLNAAVNKNVAMKTKHFNQSVKLPTFLVVNC